MNKRHFIVKSSYKVTGCLSVSCVSVCKIQPIAGPIWDFFTVKLLIGPGRIYNYFNTFNTNVIILILLDKHTHVTHIHTDSYFCSYIVEKLLLRCLYWIFRLVPEFKFFMGKIQICLRKFHFFIEILSSILIFLYQFLFSFLRSSFNYMFGRIFHLYLFFQKLCFHWSFHLYLFFKSFAFIGRYRLRKRIIDKEILLEKWRSKIELKLVVKAKYNH